MKNKVVISATVDPKTEAEIKKRAKEEERSFSQMVNIILKKGLEVRP